MVKNASSTLVLLSAEVSKYGILLFSEHQFFASAYGTYLSSCLSNLLPIKMNGKLSGSPGAACSKKPYFHFVKLSNVCFEVKSKHKAQQSAPL